MLQTTYRMDNENQTNATDTALAIKSGRPSRRNKIQTERDKDQENIDSSPNDAGQLEQSKSVVAKIEENKQSTPSASTMTVNTTVNASTPRSRFGVIHYVLFY